MSDTLSYTTATTAYSDLVNCLGSTTTTSTSAINYGEAVFIDPNSIQFSPMQNSYYTCSTPSVSVSISNIKKNKPIPPLSPIDEKIKERIAQNKKNAGIAEYFTDIKEYVPNKVYEFTITTQYSHAKKIKTVCDENDEFSLEKAFFIALAKYYYQKALTPEGIVKQAETMMCTYTYIKTVRDGMKLFKLLKEKEEWEKQEEERKKLKHQKYVQKKKDRKERLKAKENSDLCKVIIEAIKESK